MTATVISEHYNPDLSDLLHRSFGTILADPPWRFKNRTGRIAPEYHRLHRYPSLTDDEIKELPVPDLADKQSHLYLWVPNALIQTGLEVMSHWDSNTRQTSYGLRCARMVVQMAGGSDSIFET